MRWAGESALASPDDGCVLANAGLLREETGQVFGNRGIGRVRQAEFLKTDAALPDGHFGVGHEREESFDQSLFDVFTKKLSLAGSANQFRAFAKNCDRMLLALRF